MLIDIVFDGPPGPESGRFVEVENENGQSVNLGEWIQRPDGYSALRFGPGTLECCISSDQITKWRTNYSGRSCRWGAHSAVLPFLPFNIFPPIKRRISAAKTPGKRRISAG